MLLSELNKARKMAGLSPLSEAKFSELVSEAKEMKVVFLQDFNYDTDTFKFKITGGKWTRDSEDGSGAESALAKKLGVPAEKMLRAILKQTKLQLPRIGRMTAVGTYGEIDTFKFDAQDVDQIFEDVNELVSEAKEMKVVFLQDFNYDTDTFKFKITGGKWTRDSEDGSGAESQLAKKLGVPAEKMLRAILKQTKLQLPRIGHMTAVGTYGEIDTFKFDAQEVD